MQVRRFADEWPFGNANWPLKLHTHTHTHTNQPRAMPTGHRQPQSSSSMQPPPVFSLVLPIPTSHFLKKSSCPLSLPSSSLPQPHFLSPALFCQKSSQLSAVGHARKDHQEAAPRTGPPRGSAVVPHRGEMPQRSRSPWSADRLVVGVPMLKGRGAALRRCGVSGTATVSPPPLGRRRREGWAVAAWEGGRATALICHPRRPTSPSAPSSSRHSLRRSP